MGCIFAPMDALGLWQGVLLRLAAPSMSAGTGGVGVHCVLACTAKPWPRFITDGLLMAAQGSP